MKIKLLSLAGALLLAFGSVFADVEPNNSIGTAESASLGTLTGSLDLTAGDVEDYYTLSLPDDGGVTLSIAFTGTLIGQVQLFNADGNSLGSSAVVTTGSLTVDCVAEGVVYARVFRWSGTMSSYSLTISQSSLTYGMDAEPNNTTAEITEFLAVGSPQQGHMGQVNGSTFPLDVSDYYQVNLTGDGRINLSAQNDNTLLTQIVLKNRDGATLGASAVSATPTLTVDFLGGDYVYVQILRWSGCGSYSVSMTFDQPLYSNDTEPNNSIPLALPLPAATFRQGHIGYVNGVAFPLDVVDYYGAVLAGDGRVTLSAETDNGLQITLAIFNQDGSLLAGSPVSSTPTVSVDGIAKDTVFFNVNRWSGGGSYRVRYILDEPQHPNDAEPNDVLAQALPLSEGAFGTGHIGYANGAERPIDANDYYILALSGDGKVNAYVETDNGLQLTLAIFNQDGSLLAGSPVSDTISLSFDGVAQGPAYLRVSRWSGVGSYRVQYSLEEVPETNDLEPNDMLANALLIAPNFPAEGHLGYVNGAPSPVDNRDIYTFAGQSAGPISFTWATSNGLQTYVRLLNATGSVLASSAISTAGTLAYNLPDNGTYFLDLLRWSGVGGYTLGIDNGCDLTAVAAEQVISVGAQLQWAAVPGASSYNVRRGPAGGPYSVITTAAKRSVWFPLVENTDYEWQVQTVCGDRVSGYIPLRPFTTLEFPICPNIGGLLQDSLTATSIKLTWNDNPYAINYRVEYRVAGSLGGSAVNTAQPSAKLTGLLPGTNYEFRVYANCYGDGQSNFRNGTFTTPGARVGTQEAAKIWPVPASEYLNVSFPLAQDGTAQLVIVDALGRSVRTFQQAGFAGENRAELNLKGLSSGLYHLQILDNQGVQQVLPFGIR
jgi:hypothetical protein